MWRLFTTIAICALVCAAFCEAQDDAAHSNAALQAAAPGVAAPFEMPAWPMPANAVDAPVLSELRARNIKPANPCSDAVFIRRAHLDVIGTLPDLREVREFLADRRPGKRAALVDRLLERDEFADYWAMKWGDVLRVKAEFPINLWPNAVQAYHRWIRDAVRNNMPYDQFARALLTSSGSNFREPPVNFYRAVQGRDAAAIADAVALTFMGARRASWPGDRQAGMTSFFSRILYKQTIEWKEEIVCMNPSPATRLESVFPDGGPARIVPGQDPRRVFADWLITPTNEWFARAAVNRVWAWLFGRGIVHEPDDIRQDNPPANPGLLACLEKEFVDARFDLRKLFRLVLNSRTYQQSSIPRTDTPEAEALFAFYPVRRLDAEVLIDALNWIAGGAGEKYTSEIPEPFTFIPDTHRTIALADGSITSPFLEMFGRPPRDSGLASERNNLPTDDQRLYLLNSSEVQRKLQRSRRLRAVTGLTAGNRQGTIRWIYLLLLSREPMPEETAIAGRYFQSGALNTQDAVNDLAWALINSKEFLYRH